MKLLMVSVGGGRYAVSADAVSRIVDPGPGGGLEPAEGGREASLDGRRYPVVDLHRIAGEAAGRRGIYLLVVVPRGEVLVPVDEAESIRDVPPAAIAPLPPFIFAGEKRFFRGLFEDGPRRRLLLDEECLL